MRTCCGSMPCTRWSNSAWARPSLASVLPGSSAQHVLVRLDRAAQVPRVQRLHGGLQQRVVRPGRAASAARRPVAGLGVRVDGEAGEAEALLGDLDQLVEGLAGSAPRRRRPGRAAAPARPPRRRRPGSPGSRTAASASGWRRRRPWRARSGRCTRRPAARGRGLSCLHGSHHSAQKSMTTGTSVDRCRTSRSKPASSTSMTRSAGEHGPAAALPGGFGARLLRLRLGLLGRLHRGEVDDAAHGHVPWLHASILPRSRAHM